MITMRNIPPRTMRNLWDEQTTVRSGISFGIELNYNSIDKRGTTNTPGAGGLGNAGWASGEGSWNGTVLEYRHKIPRTKPKTVTILDKPEIRCISEIIEDCNCRGDLEVILQFRGFSLLGESFTKSRNDYGENVCIYYNPVRYENRRAFLILSTIGDILESEVVPIKKGINQLFSYEIYLPKLIENYNPFSMEVVQNNRLVIVSYKKRDTSKK